MAQRVDACDYLIGRIVKGGRGPFRTVPPASVKLVWQPRMPSTNEAIPHPRERLSLAKTTESRAWPSDVACGDIGKSRKDRVANRFGPRWNRGGSVFGVAAIVETRRVPDRPGSEPQQSLGNLPGPVYKSLWRGSAKRWLGSFQVVTDIYKWSLCMARWREIEQGGGKPPKSMSGRHQPRNASHVHGKL